MWSIPQASPGISSWSSASFQWRNVQRTRDTATGVKLYSVILRRESQGIQTSENIYTHACLEPHIHICLISTSHLLCYCCHYFYIGYKTKVYLLPFWVLGFYLPLEQLKTKKKITYSYFSALLPAVSSVQSVQFSRSSSVAQPCPTLCDPMSRSTPGLPVHHQLPEFTPTHVHPVRDAIQPSHPLSSPSPPAPNPSQHQGLFQ